MTPAVWLLCAAGLAALGAGGWALWRARLRLARTLRRRLGRAADPTTDPRELARAVGFES